MMTLWLATTNFHKIKEVKSFFKDTPEICFLDLTDLKRFVKNTPYIPPEETGISFKENAGIKSAGLLKFIKNQFQLCRSPFGLWERTAAWK